MCPVFIRHFRATYCVSSSVVYVGGIMVTGYVYMEDFMNQVMNILNVICRIYSHDDVHFNLVPVLVFQGVAGSDWV